MARSFIFIAVILLALLSYPQGNASLAGAKAVSIGTTFAAAAYDPPAIFYNPSDSLWKMDYSFQMRKIRF